MTSNELAFASLILLVMAIPVVWAIVDVARRPPWQFSAGRKAMWGLTLGVGFFLLPPVACISSIVYLAVLRRRFPTSFPPNQTSRFPPYGGGGQYGGGGPYGSGPYGGDPYGGGQYRGPYGGGGPYGSGPYGPGRPPSPPGPYPGGQPGAYPGGPAGGFGYPPEGQPPVMPPLPAAGWYPDPAGSSQERWWDGKGWSDHLR